MLLNGEREEEMIIIINIFLTSVSRLTPVEK